MRKSKVVHYATRRHGILKTACGRTTRQPWVSRLACCYRGWLPVTCSKCWATKGVVPCPTLGPFCRGCPDCQGVVNSNIGPGD